MITVPSAGESLALQNFLNKIPSEDSLLKLYVNDITPADDDEAESFKEAKFAGYAAARLDGGAWMVNAGDDATPTIAVYPEYVFTSNANQLPEWIFGYFIVGADSGRIKWAERFTDGPYLIENLRDNVWVEPKITLQRAVACNA